MNTNIAEDVDAGLILAAEECPPEKFEIYHSFSSHDKVIIRKLMAHGPVLIRGGRGSGKSALLIEAHRRMRQAGTTFSIYMSLRYLPLLQSDGAEYVGHFCGLLSKAISQELSETGRQVDFEYSEDVVTLQKSLLTLARQLDQRIVILFDDAAHIGREKPLEAFFDLFRTLSSSLISCKASIYPGVTKFGVRFDVFNDSTVVEISRSDVSKDDSYFLDVILARYPRLAERSTFSDRLTPEVFSKILGRAVVGNMRGFILACNRFDSVDKISIPDLNSCLLAMAQDYYWPLMEEVAPKLGVYEPLIDPATSVFEKIIEHLTRPLQHATKLIAQDRVTIHKGIVSEFAKVFEILEYLGFLAKREASRAMKSGGRGAVYAVNLCSILEKIPTSRLTIEMIDDWIAGRSELSEIHLSGGMFSTIELPELSADHALGILDKNIEILGKSRAYPYGLTVDKISRLKQAGIATIQDLWHTDDTTLQEIEGVGPAAIKRMRDVMQQAIWM
ncbi:ATP-binding protein [Novosphingobium sp. 9]|uniref:ATP-binding protein n=1 Tax=Novosphingobium sp. 9 TaxID=2025349 RepID=UPI0021B6A238|nr:ATP-binding protein [Novosphingobium sp. 9]